MDTRWTYLIKFDGDSSWTNLSQYQTQDGKVLCFVNTEKATMSRTFGARENEPYINTFTFTLIARDDNNAAHKTLFGRLLTAQQNKTKVWFQAKQGNTICFSGVLNLETLEQTVKSKMSEPVQITAYDYIWLLDKNMPDAFEYPAEPIMWTVEGRPVKYVNGVYTYTDATGGTASDTDMEVATAIVDSDAGWYFFKGDSSDITLDITVQTLIKAGFSVSDIDFTNSDPIKDGNTFRQCVHTYYNPDEEKRTFREFLGVLMFENSRVLCVSPEGKFQVKKYTYTDDDIEDATVLGDAYYTSEGMKIQGQQNKKDGLKLEWATPQARHSQVYNAGFDQSSGQEIEAGKYWPDGGNEQKIYQEYSLDSLDRKYLTKQTTRQNKDLTIMTVKHPYVTMKPSELGDIVSGIGVQAHPSGGTVSSIEESQAYIFYKIAEEFEPQHTWTIYNTLFYEWEPTRYFPVTISEYPSVAKFKLEVTATISTENVTNVDVTLYDANNTSLGTITVAQSGSAQYTVTSNFPNAFSVSYTMNEGLVQQTIAYAVTEDVAFLADKNYYTQNSQGGFDLYTSYDVGDDIPVDPEIFDSQTVPYFGQKKARILVKNTHATETKTIYVCYIQGDILYRGKMNTSLRMGEGITDTSNIDTYTSEFIFSRASAQEFLDSYYPYSANQSMTYTWSMKGIQPEGKLFSINLYGSSTAIAVVAKKVTVTYVGGEFRSKIEAIKVNEYEVSRISNTADQTGIKPEKSEVKKEIMYGESDDEFTEPTIWYYFMPGTKGKWSWIRTVISYSDGTSVTTYTKTFIGQNGEGEGVYLSNPNININCTYTSYTYDQTISISVFCRKGTERMAGTITLGSLPSGCHATKTDPTTSAEGTIAITVYSGTYLSANYGTIPVTVVADNQTWNLAIAWVKTRNGNNGSDGQDGEDVGTFRGVTNTEPTVSGLSKNDYYVTYAGVPYIYDGSEWGQMPISGDNANRLLGCLEGLVGEGVSLTSISSADSVAWFKTLIAQQAFINELFSKTITLLSGGVFQSEGFSASGSQGFQLTSAGMLIAQGAQLKQVAISENSTFNGTIITPLYQSGVGAGTTTIYRSLSATIATTISTLDGISTISNDVAYRCTLSGSSLSDVAYYQRTSGSHIFYDSSMNLILQIYKVGVGSGYMYNYRGTTYTGVTTLCVTPGVATIKYGADRIFKFILDELPTSASECSEAGQVYVDGGVIKVKIS